MRCFFRCLKLNFANKFDFSLFAWISILLPIQLDLLHWFLFSFPFKSIFYTLVYSEILHAKGICNRCRKSVCARARFSCVWLSKWTDENKNRKKKNRTKKFVLIGKCKQWQWAIALTIRLSYKMCIHEDWGTNKVGIGCCCAILLMLLCRGVKWFSWLWTQLFSLHILFGA